MFDLLGKWLTLRGRSIVRNRQDLTWTGASVIIRVELMPSKEGNVVITVFARGRGLAGSTVLFCLGEESVEMILTSTGGELCTADHTFKGKYKDLSEEQLARITFEIRPKDIRP